MTVGAIVTTSPVREADNWGEIVNENLPIAVYDSLGMAARRQIPFGDPDWIRFVEQQQKAMPTEEDTVSSLT